MITIVITMRNIIREEVRKRDQTVVERLHIKKPGMAGFDAGVRVEAQPCVLAACSAIRANARVSLRTVLT